MIRYGLIYLFLLNCLNVMTLTFPLCKQKNLDFSSYVIPEFKLVSTRLLKGGDLQEAEHELRIALVHLSEEKGPFYRVSLVHSGTEEIVSGSKLLHAKLVDFNNVGHDCKIGITSRSGLSASTRAIDINCNCMTKVSRIIDF